MAEKSVNILEIIMGALMIAAPLFGWWVRISSENPVSISFWELGLYDELQLWQSILLVACSIILLTGGALYILNGLKLLKTLPVIRFILLCAGFAGLLASTFGIMIDHELAIFQYITGEYEGLGAGIFLGIAALVFGVIGFVKDSKTNA